MRKRGENPVNSSVKIQAGGLTEHVQNIKHEQLPQFVQHILEDLVQLYLVLHSDSNSSYSLRFRFRFSAALTKVKVS